MQGGGQEHGGLVQQILETQKELEEQPKENKVEIVSKHSISVVVRRTHNDLI